MVSIYMKNKKGKKEYYAKAILTNDNKIKILKGSIINPINSNFNMNKKVNQLRTDRNIINSENELIKDIEFDSATSAAQFVCGYSVNGLMAWKTEKDKIRIKNIIREN